MLGYFVAGGQVADGLLAEVALRLQARGRRLAGVVQVNQDHAQPGRPCHMELEVLDGRARIRISQDLGPLSRGCRLDPTGLEGAAGLVEAALQAGPGLIPDLIIVNKFGKQELDGRGFRPVIGRALALGIPVLTSVNPGNLEGFQAFAGGMGQVLPPQIDAVVDWALAHG
ncbi:MAG: DUF2478 domain-containing protein [Gemmobacter sp.]